MSQFRRACQCIVQTEETVIGIRLNMVIGLYEKYYT